MNLKHFILTTTLFLISCSNMSLTPEVVRKSDVQKQQYVVIGTILDVSSVTMRVIEKPSAAAGALIGGSVGKNVTDSEPESDIAAIIGGIVGSAVGAELGSNLTQKRIELLIETNGGRMISIIQEVGKYDFRVDQKVRIIKRNGKSRVVPFD
ncbi:MAG: hypothetical protein CM15mP76_01580 [Prochlorococcus sp.]|nr:MAG: hypothetical protein CM15mP76_01580 [Prochlorococcus sp.]